MSAPFSLVDAAYAAARWGWYLAAFLLLGAGSYAPFLFRARTALHATHPEVERDLAQRAARIGFFAALALLILSAVRLYLQARTLLDPTEPVSRDFLGAILASSWGKGWLRQVAMALLAVPAFAGARAGSRLGWLIASAAGGGIGFTAGMTGHANTATAGTTAVLLDAAHVWAGGLWLGGLAVLLIAGVAACRTAGPEMRPPLLRALVADFSRRAQLFAPLTIALGLLLAVHYLGWTWPLHFTRSAYGWVLGAKLAMLAGIAAVGAYNWRVTQPGLTRERGESRLRRFSALELLLGVILLGITAVLVALPLPEGSM